ncbi:MAG: ABC transporter substrate-binding protein [Oscillospiraceae bacterium]|nr:ABC transporter substrate-binding protein [Oscillospiraceae bacterium]
MLKKGTALLTLVVLLISCWSVGANAADLEIVFWHSMGGMGGEAIDKMVSDYNATHEGVHVTAQFQGSYDDAITKLQSLAGTDAAPDIMQLYDIGTRWMIDSGNAVPIQTLIDRDGWEKDVIEPNIAGYYTVENQLYSMPFNSSTPILYYNKDAFAAAGLDPEMPPQNWDELEQAARALTHEENGESIYGFAMQIYGWFFEQYMSKQGLTYANNGNGRDATATMVEFDSNGGGVALLSRWKQLVDEGIVANLGRGDSPYQTSFATGKAAIIFGSTASLNGILNAVDGQFEVGTGYLPDLITGFNGGVSIGGGSLWLMEKGDDASKEAAWDVVKYLVSPEVQYYWNTQTGYFPINVQTYDLPEMQAHLDARPQFRTAIDQLHATTLAARGALLGVFTEARQTVEQNIEKVLDGSLTPEQAVAAMAASINAAIENYNIANE